MKDDPFLSISSEREGIAGEKGISPTPSNKNKVIERTLMTMQKIRIYPDGSAYIYKTQSWFDKKGTIVKKRIKKVAKVKESKVGTEEVY